MGFKMFGDLGLFSGNILIEGNYFTQIIGCNMVHTSLVQVTIIDVKSELLTRSSEYI